MNAAFNSKKMQQAHSEALRMNKAYDDQAKAIQKAAAEQEKYQKGLKHLHAQYDKNYAKQQKLAKIRADLNKLVANGNILNSQAEKKQISQNKK